jgi:Tol biopolymer transport system component
MKTTTKTTTLASLALILLAVPAGAYHRQTPPIVALTTSGDTPLPRVPVGGRRLAIAIDASGRQIFRQDWKHNVLEQITTSGDNQNPTISARANTIAWDADCALAGCDDPGRQVFLWTNGSAVEVTHDPTGTSVNPALSGKGTALAFESIGDLVGANPSGTLQIYLRTSRDGQITQASHGAGTSANAALDQSGLHLVFESTNDLSGNDTGTSQIWFVPVKAFPQIVTNGQGPSRRPAISGNGHFVAFESTADLIGDLHDTGVSQIFVWDAKLQGLTQVTHDAQGCAGASVSSVPADMSVGYTCHGQGFFYKLLTGKHFQLPIPGGDTARAISELGGRFMVVTTTSNLLGVGTTPGHQVYLLNLFKLSATPLD